MSSSMLHIKPEEIAKTEERRRYTVGIVGCGLTGILHAYLLAEAGFKVKCADTDQIIVNGIVRGKVPFLKREIEQKLRNHLKTGLLSATNDVKKTASESDIIIITVPAEIDKKKKVSYRNLESICKVVGSSLRRDSLVIIANTVGIGATQNMIKETLENTSGFKVGADVGLAYSPIQFLETQSFETLKNQERIIAAADKNSLDAASTILQIISKNVKKTDDIRTAEAVTLFKVVQEDVSAALVKEIAFFCEKAGLDIIEAQKLAENSFSTFSWSMPLSDSMYETPHLLLDEAENLNLKFRIPTIAREINEKIAKHAINLVKDALKNCGRPLRRARVSLLGISQTPDMQTCPKRMVEELAKMLETRGTKVSIYDPYSSGDKLIEMESRFKKNMTDALEGADCIVILTGHDQFRQLNLKRLKAIMRKPAAIVDLEGIFEPKRVEEEGFVYRGLGRGVWTK